jgi:hypothetical protein
MSRGRRDEEPRTRVGICCGAKCLKKYNREGAHHPDVALYRVWPQYRYRCRICYKLETGGYP